MSKITKKSKNLRLYTRVSIAAYVAVVVGASFLFIYPPDNFNATAIIMPLVAALLVCSVVPAYSIARTPTNTPLTVIGTIALSVFITFIGFFAVAAVAWFVGVYHAGSA